MPSKSGFGNSRKKGAKVKYGQGKNPITFKSPLHDHTKDTEGNIITHDNDNDGEKKEAIESAANKGDKKAIASRKYKALGIGSLSDAEKILLGIE